MESAGRRLIYILDEKIFVQSTDREHAYMSFSPAPYTPNASDRMSVVSGNGAATRTARPHILIVEDNEDTSVLMEQILEDFGNTTVTADPHEALTLASQQAFDLVMLDINLGAAMDGTDVLRELRTNLPYSDTPILALTAYALPGDRERFLAMGFTAYMSKPFEVDDLLEVSNKLIRESIEPIGNSITR